MATTSAPVTSLLLLTSFGALAAADLASYDPADPAFFHGLSPLPWEELPSAQPPLPFPASDAVLHVDGRTPTFASSSSLVPATVRTGACSAGAAWRGLPCAARCAVASLRAGPRAMVDCMGRCGTRAMETVCRCTQQHMTEATYGDRRHRMLLAYVRRVAAVAALPYRQQFGAAGQAQAQTPLACWEGGSQQYLSSACSTDACAWDSLNAICTCLLSPQ